ncbi:uncharacterized protein EV422DRAFT_613514 [Fimicolochytrium jonesii]|uniref:uncharacterized protein n=1 Tax=Fimicolochytrium jonesii TaxID=1396493 RepID=UPI0022FEEA29|nr:uncharacterized protein EV422DRAFT_613514 [Fimicolochytrium jonesii]KAI8822436.1 hypothetical protein EV422DRAFT_613514 [Fimicolochytrium jonesii]
MADFPFPTEFFPPPETATVTLTTTRLSTVLPPTPTPSPSNSTAPALTTTTFSRSSVSIHTPASTATTATTARPTSTALNLPFAPLDPAASTKAEATPTGVMADPRAGGGRGKLSRLAIGLIAAGGALLLFLLLLLCLYRRRFHPRHKYPTKHDEIHLPTLPTITNRNTTRHRPSTSSLHPFALPLRTPSPSNQSTLTRPHTPDRRSVDSANRGRPQSRSGSGWSVRDLVDKTRSGSRDAAEELQRRVWAINDLLGFNNMDAGGAGGYGGDTAAAMSEWAALPPVANAVNVGRRVREGARPASEPYAAFENDGHHSNNYQQQQEHTARHIYPPTQRPTHSSTSPPRATSPTQAAIHEWQTPTGRVSWDGVANNIEFTKPRPTTIAVPQATYRPSASTRRPTSGTATSSPPRQTAMRSSSSSIRTVVPADFAKPTTKRDGRASPLTSPPPDLPPTPPLHPLTPRPASHASTAPSTTEAPASSVGSTMTWVTAPMTNSTMGSTHSFSEVTPDDARIVAQTFLREWEGGLRGRS